MGLTIGVASPASRPSVRSCDFALWASRYSLKGFCREAPNRGRALWQKRRKGGGDGTGEGERKKERKKGRGRERGHINFTYRLERSVSFLYPASPFSPRSQTEGDRDRAFIPNKRRKKKTVKVQLVLGTTYPKHLKRITKKKYAEKRT